MTNSLAYKSAVEIDGILSSIKEMQDRILDIYSEDCGECIELLKDLSSLNEEAEILYDKFESILQET